MGPMMAYLSFFILEKYEKKVWVHIVIYSLNLCIGLHFKQCMCNVCCLPRKCLHLLTVKIVLKVSHLTDYLHMFNFSFYIFYTAD